MQNSPVQKIKERLTIEDVVSSYLKLEQAGTNFKARCPFHNEKTPSFFVSPARSSYYCFGCGASGDLFSFVEAFEGLDFKGALKMLAERAGVPLEFEKGDTGKDERDILYQILNEATTYFENNLMAHTQALEYLKQRGLLDKTIKQFRLGFAKDDWHGVHEHLKKKGFKDNQIELAGLIKKGEKGYYDRFRGRIMFPIADSGARVIAFSGRIFVDDGKSAKYVNSPETPVFHKSSVLYGIGEAKDSIRKNNFAILVEGQMDLLMSHQAGFRNTIASSGTALTDSLETKENGVSNLGLVKRLSNNIVLAYDADKAGLAASERASKIALSMGMDVKVAKMPEGIDPADLILKHGVDAWRLAIKDSKHVIVFLTEKIVELHSKDMRKVGVLIRERVLPYVAELGSDIEKAYFLKSISDTTGISEDALKGDLKRIASTANFANGMAQPQPERVENRKEVIIAKLFSIYLWQETLPEQLIDMGHLVSALEESTGLKLRDLKEKYKNMKGEMIFRAEVFYTGRDFTKDVEELLLNLEAEVLKEQMSEKMLQLKKINGDTEESRKILAELQIINNKVQQLKGTKSSV